jgi:hypothetical protein
MMMMMMIIIIITITTSKKCLAQRGFERAIICAQVQNSKPFASPKYGINITRFVGLEVYAAVTQALSSSGRITYYMYLNYIEPRIRISQILP